MYRQRLYNLSIGMMLLSAFTAECGLLLLYYRERARATPAGRDGVVVVVVREKRASPRN